MVWQDVARHFDAGADDYETLEPWYVHLYERLHAILDETLVPGPGGGRALDVGCGTGFQTARLAALGWQAHGLDVSAGLLAVAQRRLAPARLLRADAETLPYPAAAFQAATCCGSVLSLVERPAHVLAELGRVLVPGGRLLLECEHRWSLDLAWAAASALAGDPLGYGQGVREAWRPLGRSRGAGVVLRYPGSPPLRLFTRGELEAMLAAAGLAVERAWGLHGATNLIPSPVLHRPHLGPLTAALYRPLRALDRALAPTAAGRGLANSLVLLARRRAGASPGPALRPTPAA